MITFSKKIIFLTFRFVTVSCDLFVIQCIAQLYDYTWGTITLTTVHCTV